MSGIFGVFFEFLAQFPDVIIDGAGGGVAIVSPDFVEQLVAGKDALRILEEEFEDFEFVCCEGHGSPGASGLEAGKIHGDITEGEAFGGGGRSGGAADHGAHSSQQLAGAERFGDVIIRTQLEEKDLLADFGGGAEDDDGGGGGFLLNLAANVAAVHSGEAEVQHDEIGDEGGKTIEGFRAIGGNANGVILGFEDAPEGALNSTVILDDQDTVH